MTTLQKIDAKALYPATTGEVSEKVSVALVQLAEMLPNVAKTWNRHHSDVQWNVLALDEETETRNLRQLSAEIKRKRDALTEAHFAYETNILQAKIHERDAESLSGLEAEMELLKANNERAKAQMKHEAVMGATKDIAILRATYQKILDRIIDKHGKCDESVFEAEEKEYWIRRIMVQATQDVRATGRIGQGNQVELEHLGIEPIEALREIDSFLSEVNKKIAEGKPCDRESRDAWLSKVVDKYGQRVQARIDRMGQTTDHLFLMEKA